MNLNQIARQLVDLEYKVNSILGSNFSFNSGSPSSDEIQEFNSTTDFPAIGNSNKYYIAKDTNNIYRWNLSTVSYMVIGGSSSSVTNTSFNASLLFDKDYRLMTHVVAGAIAFAPNTTNRILGGAVYVRLIADGVNTPTYDSAFNLTTGVYDNTFGMINRLIFMWNGSEYEYSIAQLGTLPNDPPTATVQAITGTLTVGSLLTGHYTYSDTDLDAEGTSTFVWQRSDNGTTGWANISAATSSTYTLQAADSLKYIRFGVVPVAATGDSPGTQVFSAATTQIPDTIAPTITSAVATDAHTIVFTFSENVNGTGTGLIPRQNTGALTVSARSGSNGTNTRTLTITETLLNSDTLDYHVTSSNITDTSSNALANVTGPVTITNSVPAGNGTPTVVHYNDPLITYTGGWTDGGSGLGNFASVLCVSGTTYAEIDFVDGVKFDYESGAGFEGGYYSFSIDGGTATVVQALDAVPHIFEAHPNDGGPHTLRMCLDHPSGAFILIKNITTYTI